MFTLPMDKETTPAGSIDSRLVDDVLTSFFARSKARAEAMHPDYRTMWEHLEDSTSGGKRFRPRLVMTVYSLLGGSDLLTAATVAASNLVPSGSPRRWRSTATRSPVAFSFSTGPAGTCTCGRSPQRIWY